MKRLLFALLLTVAGMAGLAQQNPTSAEIYLGLKKLNVLGSVLYVAAHPDDENTRLITWLSKDRLYRTGYLSLTRGDGGQNLIGEEQGVELGLIRTQELLAARRIDGGEQFFTRAFDFGFSKNPEETFTKWDRNLVLEDVVRIVRQFRPDVIVTRFPTTGEGGHGHHTASAILANEAFTAAADPKRFPNAGAPWQAKRILWNTFNFGGNNTTSAAQFKVDVGGYNPLLGKSYGEIAAVSRSQHKSQGFGVPLSRGESFEYFRTTGGEAPKADLFEGVSTTWSRVEGGKDIQQMIDQAIASFDFSVPQKSVSQLVRIYKALGRIGDQYWRERKKAEVQELIQQASGLFIDVYTGTPAAAVGDGIEINRVINNRLGIDARLAKVELLEMQIVGSFEVPERLPKNLNFPAKENVKLSESLPITQPYWLSKKKTEGMFSLLNSDPIGQADVSPALTYRFQILIEGEPFEFLVPLRYKFNDQVKGEQYQPFVVLPKYTVTVPRELTVQRGDDVNESFSYTAQRSLPSLDIFRSVMGTTPLRIVHDTLAGKSKTRAFTTRMTRSGTNGGQPAVFSYYENKEGSVTAKQEHTIRYDHIPWIHYFSDAENKYVLLDVKTAGKKIGYIVGAGDKVPEALEQMGYEVTLLTEKELARNNLGQFDAIISGVRAHNANEWMDKYYDKLMAYVENGGNYIVQYSQSNNIRGRIGPYPFNIVNKRVTNENATVTFLKPEHPVLNYPNKITSEDFRGWIQERSTYHAGNIDAQYERIFSMADPNEAPDEGSLIIAKHGKGTFAYTGLVFFRELPAGVPGAYRLLANIIALNRKKEF